jgi:hypothetical protein
LKRLSYQAVIAAFFLCATTAGCSSGGALAPSLHGGSLLQSPGGDVAGALQSRDMEPTYVQQNFMPSTWDGIHAFQSFDAYVPYKNMKVDGSRYNLVWGTGNPTDWSQGNPSILNTWYLPMTTDGDKRNSLSWWQAFHPDWILYHCDRVTPAWSQGLPQVPLDISNPDAVRWQIQTYGGKAEVQGYSGIAADLVGFANGNYGCGVWVNGQWVQKFSGQKSDPQWTQAVENWAAYAHSYLHGLSRPLLLAANHVPSSNAFGDPNEMALLANLDVDEDEMGFSNYGGGPVSDVTFNNTIAWMRYTQSIGHAYFVVDKWKTKSVTTNELDWSIATYLMGKRGAASLDVVDAQGYGYEYWFGQYASAIGRPCGKMYATQGVYLRRFTGGLSIVNTSTSATFTVTLPQPSYTSIDGGAVASPAQIAPSSGMVLLQQTPGC